MGREKGADEVFCRSCGSAIKESAEICPECGVKNHAYDPPKASGGSTDSQTFFDKHGSKIAWVVGIFLLLGGLGYLAELGTSPVRAIVGGGIIMASGAFALPPVRERLKPLIEGRTPIELTRGAVVVIVLVGFMVGAMAAPDTGTTDSGLSSNEQLGQSDGGGQQQAQDQDGGSGGGADTTPTYAVRIQYSGEWGGALSVTGGGESQSESISGVGSTTIDITGDVSIISVNAQKKDGGSGTIVVQILKNGEVVSEASTSSEYGVAQTSKSFY